MALPLIIGGAIALYFVNKFLPNHNNIVAKRGLKLEDENTPKQVLSNTSGKSFSDARFDAATEPTITERFAQADNNPASSLSPGALPEQDDNNNGREPVMNDDFGGANSLPVQLMDQ